MKKVLVTGGNRGIGKAICQLLLEQYPDVTVVMGSRDLARGQEAAKSIAQQVKGANDRLQVIALDVGSPDSIQQAASQFDGKLYGIVNNAGLYSKTDCKLANTVNYLGAKRVNEAFLSKLQTPGGRIVHVGSASGPMFVENCNDASLRKKFTEPWTIQGGLEELDQLATQEPSPENGDAYGYSKALLSAYTWLFAQQHPDLIINCVTPGFIDTDLTKGWGATKTPADGAAPVVWLLMSEELLKLPSGLYYGSDCKRSPWHVYRGPGDPVYEGPVGP